MKKDIPQNKRSLSRREMLERHRRREYQDTGHELNEFSRRALSGLQYHPEKEPLDATLRRLDRRVAASARRPFPIRRFLSIAAAALLLLATGYFLFLQPSGQQGLFAQHFDYLPSAVKIESGNRGPSSYEEGPALREKAMQAYEAGRFEQARELMEQHLSRYRRDTEIRFYLGIILLGEGETEAAIRNFEATLSGLPRPAYERPAKWYLALAFLQSGRDESAKGLFRELKNGSDRYATGAGAILKKL